MRRTSLLIAIVGAGLLVVAAHAAQKVIVAHCAGGGGGSAGGGLKLIGSIPASAAGKSSGGGNNLTGGAIAAAQVWRGSAASADAAAAAQAGMVSTLAAVGTRGGGAQITFSLSGAATVEVRVLNIAGRPIRTITPGRDCSAGLNTFVWTGLSDAGLSVPSGQYLVEVRARAGDGAQSAAMTAVRIGP